MTFLESEEIWTNLSTERERDVVLGVGLSRVITLCLSTNVELCEWEGYFISSFLNYRKVCTDRGNNIVKPFGQNYREQCWEWRNAGN